MEKIKTILIKGELKGRGIVNFDDKAQRWILSKHGIVNGKLEENVKLGKKVFYKTGKFKEDGTEIYDYKIKISGDCLRKNIFDNDMEVTSSYLIQDPFILGTYMLSPVGVMRGYGFIAKDETLKDKSPLTVTDAIQVNNAKSELEIGTTTGERSDTSMFFTEKAGDMVYKFKGQISMKQLQFLSADPCFDRLAINPDLISSGDADIILNNHYGDKANVEYGIFSSMGKYSSNSYGEYGIRLNDELCEIVIKDTLKNILSVNISRNNAYAATSALKIKLVDNIIGIGQKMEDEENWIELKTEADVDALELSNIYSFYEKATDEEVEMRKKMIDEYNEKSSNKKAEKDAKKAEKEAKKAAKKKGVEVSKID